MRTSAIATLVALGVVAILALSTVNGSFYTVDQGERAVLLTNGAISGVEDPGLHFKWPFFQTVEKLSLHTTTARFDKLNSYSSDQQPADVTLSVTFQLDPSRVADVYAKFGDYDALESRVIYPAVNQEFKVVFGRYSAAKAINDRGALNADAFTAIAAALAGYPELQLKSVQVENIDFSQQYIQSIEQRMQAEIEVQKIEQNAQREKVQAEITVIQAKAQADSQLAVARAQADAARLQGDAQAAAIRAKGDALKDNPALVALTTAERWNGVLPTTMVPGSAVPFVGVK